jgi:hypothetical protein
MKKFYSQHLKTYISTGETKVIRAQFNELYQKTREAALRPEYIEAGWKRTGLYPFDPRRVLQLPELRQYRQTTPDLAPPQSSDNLSPHDEYEWTKISEEIAPQLSRSGRRKLTGLRNAFIRESSARRLLSYDVSTARKRTLEHEEREGLKRLKKQDDKIIWSAQEVMRAKGHTEDEIAVFMSALPNRDPIYQTGEL